MIKDNIESLRVRHAYDKIMMSNYQTNKKVGMCKKDEIKTALSPKNNFI